MDEKNKETQNLKKRNLGKKFKKFMKKSIPMSLALSIALNSTLGVAIIQHYFYKSQINKFVAYTDQYVEELQDNPEKQTMRLESELFPEAGVVLPVKWGDVGKRLVELGVIDQDRYLELYKGGPLSGQNSEYAEILAGNHEGNIILTKDNSRFVLNTLWAMGLAQQSDVLAEMQAEYPEVGNLAATGGWTLSTGDAMDHYGKHNLFDLSEEQQELVKQIASNIYRPCCNNHTAFADCNHGMAMLGLIEMMVAEGHSEEEIYDSALAVNSIWFPDTYLTIAKYLEDSADVAWADVDPKEILGGKFSSGSGYRSLLAQVNPVQSSGSGGGCGV